VRRLLAIAALLAAGCFEPWPVTGPYRCGAGACPDNMVCDDGVCCFPDKSPVCRALVLDGGTCFNGSTPQTYYEDSDGDGFGNKNASRLYCAAPVSDAYVLDSTDCDDLKPTVNPTQLESCDGYDNDCDGVIDDGQTPLKTVFSDDDKDSYGDPARPLIVCQTPEGYVDNNQDCGPADRNRHPGASELCNGLDDDCDGTPDDGPIESGRACGDAGFGECSAGTTACLGGKLECLSNNVPVPDVCDSLDNNCNGKVDEQPECGGPRYLLGPGVTIGAQNLRVTVPFPPPATCLKNYGTMYTGDSWSPPTWAGTTSYSHVWWAEAPGTATWDLSKPGTALHVNFGYTQLNGDPAGGWSGANWPVIYLCDPTGTAFNRYVPTGSGLMGPGASGTVNSMMPIAGGGGWTVGIGSGFDIKKVKRLEVYVKPDYYMVVTGPSFTVSFRPDAGFVAP
jgi:hypothetical protein